MRLSARYSLSNLAKALRNPYLFSTEVRRLALSANAACSRLRRQDNGCDVVEEDWDNLVILDGCRYDLFQSENIINGRLKSRISAGSESWEFLRANFQGQQLHETVYITANPHASKLDDNTFHRTVNLLKDRWDEELKTVTPEAMTEEAVAIYEEHSNKRLIVHYMQPHFPFIGEKGREITHAGVSQSGEGDDEPHIWTGLLNGRLDVDETEVYEAYRENLELTLPCVRELINSLDGKSVVTADHGNLIGEWTGPIPVKGYGHPRGFYAPGLVTVPWLVIDSEERRHVIPNRPSNHNQIDPDTVEARLKDLGYR